MNNRKPRRYSKKPSYTQGGKKGVSNAVKKYVKKVASKTRPEMKNANVENLEQEITSGIVAGSFQWAEFPLLSQGVGRDQRIGNEIYLHGHHSKGSFYNNSATTLIVRRLIVGYASGIAKGGSAELFDMLTGAGQGITSSTTGYIENAKINKAQFKVYFDKTFKIAPNTSTDGNQTKLFNYFLKIGGKKIKYEANNTGLLSQDWRFGEVIMVAAADHDSTGLLETCQTSRFYFTDP